MPNTDIISTAEASDIIGVDVATVNRWARSGELPPIAQASGVTGARFFKRTDVEKARKQHIARLEARLALAGAPSPVTQEEAGK